MAQINQPMYILRDDTERFQGNQALRIYVMILKDFKEIKL